MLVAPDLTLRAGEEVLRADLNRAFGGGIQGGMLTPAGGRYIFLFSDPAAADLYGYKFDGWADASRRVFYYTGEGPEGPQSITRRNKALLESPQTGREVHLFMAVGKRAGSQARVHEYLGQFTVDPGLPYRVETAPDYRGTELRSVLVFTLNRVDAEPLPANAQHPLAARPSPETRARIVPREANNTPSFPRVGITDSIGVRRERALEDQLIRWLEDVGKPVSRMEIRIAGQSGRLYTDTWVDTDRELFEVKGNATRNDVRMAVAQLLDYSRHITPPPARGTVVLPTHPGSDLVDFIASLGLHLAVMTGAGLERVHL